jgi:hypothetical protein
MTPAGVGVVFGSILGVRVRTINAGMQSLDVVGRLEAGNFARKYFELFDELRTGFD